MFGEKSRIAARDWMSYTNTCREMYRVQERQ